MNDDARRVWDAQAAGFDEDADHGLRDPAVRAAWAALLLPVLPGAPSMVADLGCGTGSLSVLLAGVGHDVHGLDIAPKMLDLARAKAAGDGLAVEFRLGDAAEPPWPAASFDAVLARHVLWALPDPERALARWIGLLRGDGPLVLVEGFWSTGAGLTADDCRALVLRHRREADVRRLADPVLWGREIDDERYLLVSRR